MLGHQHVESLTGGRLAVAKIEFSSHESRWLEQLADSDAATRGFAALRLADVACERHEFDQAIKLLETAAYEGHAIIAPRAAFALGQIFSIELGESHKAQLAYRLASDLSTPEDVPDVVCNIAARWAVEGRTSEAINAYRGVIQAVESSSDDASMDDRSVAAYRLGHLLSEAGDSAGAEEAWRWAINADDEVAAPHAAIALAELLAGDPGRGRDVDDLLTWAMHAHHPDCSPQAAFLLAGRCRQAARDYRALDLYRQVAECGHPDFAADAKRAMDELLDKRVSSYQSRVLEEHYGASPAYRRKRRMAIHGSSSSSSATALTFEDSRGGSLYWPSTVKQAHAIAEGAARRASSSASFALNLMLEHDMALGLADSADPRWLAALTGGVGLQQLQKQIPSLSAAIAREHLSPLWTPAQAATVDSLAAIGNISAANQLFERYHRRALLLPFISHAFLSVRGGFGRTAAFELYARAGRAGQDARKAYGNHKEPGRGRASVIGGLAPITGDTVAPVTMLPIVHGTWDDPDHPGFEARQRDCSAAKALAPLGLQPAGSIAAFAAHQFELLQETRAILTHAALRGSRTCEEHDVDPSHMLEWAMPNRVVIGKLALGASGGKRVTEVPLLPGLDAELLLTGDRHAIDVLAYAADHLTEYMASLQSQLKKLSIADDDEYFHGPELTGLLTGDGRWSLPGLDEMSSAALGLIGAGELAGHAGIPIESSAVRYFRVRQARLRGAQGPRLAVNLLARVRGSDLVVWSTMQPLTGACANLPIMTSELQLGAELATNASSMFCLDRFFTRFMPHQAQPTALATRAYMYVQLMLANQGTVAHMRSEQARHPYLSM